MDRARDNTESICHSHHLDETLVSEMNLISVLYKACQLPENETSNDQNLTHSFITEGRAPVSFMLLPWGTVSIAITSREILFYM